MPSEPVRGAQDYNSGHDDLDLSDVLFLATANVIENIPQPLLDRMGREAYDSARAAIRADPLTHSDANVPQRAKDYE